MVWRIRRKIGMSGGLFANELLRETGVEISLKSFDGLRRRHAEAILHRAVEIRPLPDACDFAGRTDGGGRTSAPSLSALGVDPAKAPVVTRDQLKYAKPDPDLFLAAAERLGAPIETAVVIGDSIWVDSLLEGGEFELPLRSKPRAPPG